MFFNYALKETWPTTEGPVQKTGGDWRSPGGGFPEKVTMKQSPIVATVTQKLDTLERMGGLVIHVSKRSAMISFKKQRGISLNIRQ